MDNLKPIKTSYATYILKNDDFKFNSQNKFATKKKNQQQEPTKMSSEDIKINLSRHLFHLLNVSTTEEEILLNFPLNNAVNNSIARNNLTCSNLKKKNEFEVDHVADRDSFQSNFSSCIIASFIRKYSHERNEHHGLECQETIFDIEMINILCLLIKNFRTYLENLKRLNDEAEHIALKLFRLCARVKFELNAVQEAYQQNIMENLLRICVCVILGLAEKREKSKTTTKSSSQSNPLMKFFSKDDRKVNVLKECCEAAKNFNKHVTFGDVEKQNIFKSMGILIVMKSSESNLCLPAIQAICELGCRSTCFSKSQNLFEIFFKQTGHQLFSSQPQANEVILNWENSSLTDKCLISLEKCGGLIFSQYKSESLVLPTLNVFLNLLQVQSFDVQVITSSHSHCCCVLPQVLRYHQNNRVVCMNIIRILRALSPNFTRRFSLFKTKGFATLLLSVISQMSFTSNSLFGNKDASKNSSKNGGSLQDLHDIVFVLAKMSKLQVFVEEFVEWDIFFMTSLFKWIKILLLPSSSLLLSSSSSSSYSDCYLSDVDIQSRMVNRGELFVSTVSSSLQLILNLLGLSLRSDEFSLLSSSLSSSSSLLPDTHLSPIVFFRLRQQVESALFSGSLLTCLSLTVRSLPHFLQHTSSPDSIAQLRDIVTCCFGSVVAVCEGGFKNYFQSLNRENRGLSIFKREVSQMFLKTQFLSSNSEVQEVSLEMAATALLAISKIEYKPLLSSNNISNQQLVNQKQELNELCCESLLIANKKTKSVQIAKMASLLTLTYFSIPRGLMRGESVVETSIRFKKLSWMNDLSNLHSAALIETNYEDIANNAEFSFEEIIYASRYERRKNYLQFLSRSGLLNGTLISSKPLHKVMNKVFAIEPLRAIIASYL